MNNTEKLYNEIVSKQNANTKKAMLLCSGSVGLVFLILSIILISLQVQEDGIYVGYIFLPISLVLLALGIIFNKMNFAPMSYEKYKSRLEKYGGLNAVSMAIQIQLLEKKVEFLEETLKKHNIV